MLFNRLVISAHFQSASGPFPVKRGFHQYVQVFAGHFVISCDQFALSQTHKEKTAVLFVGYCHHGFVRIPFGFVDHAQVEPYLTAKDHIHILGQHESSRSSLRHGKHQISRLTGNGQGQVKRIECQ